MSERLHTSESASKGQPGQSTQGQSAQGSSEHGRSAQVSEQGRSAQWGPPDSDAITPPGGVVSVAPPRVSEPVRVNHLPPAEMLQGRVLANRYLLEELLESTPAVLRFKAYHLALDKAVSVQVLPRGLACDDPLAEQVRQAAHSARGANPLHVVETLDFAVSSDGWPYLSTPLEAGPTLSSVLQEKSRFVLRRVLHIGKQICLGIAAGHEVGLVHGHLRPELIYISNPGTPAEVVSVSGFGLQRARSGAVEAAQPSVYGSAHFLSPEHAGTRPLGAASDVYSVGVLLYLMMTGSVPFGDSDFSALQCQHLDDQPRPPASLLPNPGALAKALEAIVQRCLQKDPAQRYQRVVDLVSDLTRLEEAAMKSKRRPVTEVARPESTIHSPAPRNASSMPDAKVIVGQDPEPSPAAPRARTQPPRVSKFQETVKISAREVQVAMARRKTGWERVRAEYRIFASSLAASLRSLARTVSGVFQSRRPPSLPPPSDGA